MSQKITCIKKIIINNDKSSFRVFKTTFFFIVQLLYFVHACYLLVDNYWIHSEMQVTNVLLVVNC